MLFSGSLEPLELALKETGYKQTRTDLDALRKALRTEVRGIHSTRKRNVTSSKQKTWARCIHMLDGEQSQTKGSFKPKVVSPNVVSPKYF